VIRELLGNMRIILPKSVKKPYAYVLKENGRPFISNFLEITRNLSLEELADMVLKLS